MKKVAETIHNIIPSQRSNSRFKTTVEEFYKNKKERYHATISADKKSITIFGNFWNGTEFSKTFSIGDTAEYDSYNLHYLGNIVKISNKSVTIEEEYSTRKHRLDLYTFISRNKDLDVEEIAEKNHETMMYI